MNSLIKNVLPFKNEIEIIVIDDCGKDGTEKIIDQYVKQYDFIKVLHKVKNEGLTLSRIDSVKIARGKYITFLDADDYIFDNLKARLDIIEQKGADIHEFAFEYCYPDGHKERPIKKINQNTMLKAKDYLVDLINYSLSVALWHRFYIRENWYNVIRAVELHIKWFINSNLDDMLLTPLIFKNSDSYFVSDILNIHYSVFSETSVQLAYKENKINTCMIQIKNLKLLVKNLYYLKAILLCEKKLLRCYLVLIHQKLNRIKKD